MKMLRCLLSGKIFFCLLLLLCSGFCVDAQDSEVLSKDPRVVKMYYPEKNTTVVYAKLMSIELMLSTAEAPIYGGFTNPPSLVLDGAWYSYAGRNPLRPPQPQTVSFDFIPKREKKGVLNFSLTVEKSVVYEGEVSFGSYLVILNGSKIKQQYLTVAIPTDIFMRAAQAKKVKFKLGSRSYELNRDDRKGIAALAATIESTGK